VIKTARQQVLHDVDVVPVQTCWTVGQHIVEFEQGEAARAAYGKRLLADLAQSLTAEFGKSFDASNLRYMRFFYQAFPKCDALRHELSWTHYRSLLRINETAARLLYMNEAAGQNWSTRALDRQIGTPVKLSEITKEDAYPYVWNDPSEMDGINQSIRGPGMRTFGEDVFEKFLRINGLERMVRGHSVVEGGFKWWFRGRLLLLYSAGGYGERELEMIEDESIYVQN